MAQIALPSSNPILTIGNSLVSKPKTFDVFQVNRKSACRNVFWGINQLNAFNYSFSKCLLFLLLLFGLFPFTTIAQDSVLVTTTLGTKIKVAANSPFAIPRVSHTSMAKPNKVVSKAKFGLLGVSPTMFYVRNYEPWGVTTNVDELNQAWGSGNYTITTYYGISPTTLFSPSTSVVYLEAGQDNTSNIGDLINNNLTLVQNWVSAGGRLFINAGPWYGGSINLGFGNNTLNFNDGTNTFSYNSFIASGEQNHAIFNGPFTPVGTTWSGNYFAHSTITSNNATALINGNAGVVLSELKYGSGIVLFGGMTSAYFHNPQNYAENLRANIFYYLANVSLVPSITSFTPTTAGSSNTVTINGLNLSGATALSFGGVAATSFNVVNGTTISAIVGSGASGSVSVTTPAGTATLAGFIYCNSFVTPSLSIIASTNNICSGSLVTFTATPTNGGGSPSYQWQKNGNNVGTNSTTYSDVTLVNGDVITCIITNNSVCLTTNSATSNSITMQVSNYVTPSVTISSSPSNTTVAAGGSISFSATPTNGGTTPIYQWQVNGNNVGTNSATYTDNTVNNKDVVSCMLTSNGACITNSDASSNSLTAHLIPVINSFAPQTMYTGGTVTITGSYFTGATAVSFGGSAANSFTVVNDHTITAILGSGATGNVSVTTLGGTVTSAGFNLCTNVTPSVSIAASSSTIWSGYSVTFTATPTNGGASPSYQWLKNGFNVGTNSAIYTDAALNNNDKISCVLTANNVCQTTATAISNSITETVTPAASITSFTPVTASGGTTITLTGTNFTGTTAVKFGGIAASSFTIVNATTITAEVSSSGASGNVSIFEAGGTTSLAGFNFLPPPTISAFTPTTASTGKTITITGTNFTDASAVSFGGISATSFTVVSTTSITAVIGAGSSGNVSVTTNSGNATKSGFIYTSSPTITSFTPTTASTGATITIKGSYFTGSTAITFGGTAATSFVVVNDTIITAVVGAGTSGNLSITNAIGTSSLAGFSFFVQPTINTVAGNGNASFSGDGGYAVNAGLSGPMGLVFDADGNYYIVDGDNNRIRKVQVSTGIITTVAGNGSSSFSGDGGLATSAGLSVYSITLDKIGNIYVADYLNNRIRKITIGTGIISTVAGTGTASFSGDGGPATSATINYPSGIALDASGNMYISEYNNNRIRKVTASTGIISTIVGTGIKGYSGDGGAATSAQIFRPLRIVLDATASNLYIADYGYYHIRNVNLNTGIITTVAGTGSLVSSGDGGYATSASLIAYDLALDSKGNLYAADAYNNNIRKIILSTGVISTVAGIGTVGFSGDGGSALLAKMSNSFGLAIDTLGNIYIADAGNNRIRKVSITPTITSFTPTTAPTGATITIKGSNFTGATAVSFGGTSATSFVVVNDTIITAMLGAGTSGSLSITTTNGTGSLAGFTYLTAPSIAYTGGAKTYTVGTAITAISPSNTGGTVSGNGQVTVSAFAGSGSQGSADGNSNVASFNYPTGAAIDASGNMYVADSYNHKIRKVSALGVVTTLAGSGSVGSADGTGSAASFNYPYGVAVDAIGNVYVADNNNNKIRKVSPLGVVTTLAGSGAQGNTDGTGSAATFGSPTGVAVDAVGNVYVADVSNNKIRKISSLGVVTTLAGSGSVGSTDGTGILATFNRPTGVAVDGVGNVYVSDTYNQKIRKITPLGVVTTLTGSGSVGSADGTSSVASFGYAAGLTVDAVCNVYVADTDNSKVRKVSPLGVVTTLAGSGVQGSADGIGSAASFHTPYGLAVDTSGNVYLADATNNKIRKITPGFGYTVSPTLPTGLSFDGSSGTISGTATVTTAATTYTISATNLAGSSSATVNIATVALPVITSFTPTTAPTGATITIKGINFSGATTVSLGGTAATSFVVVNDTIITAIVGAGTSGSLSITNANGSGSLAGFTYLTSPNIAYTGGTKTYTVGTTITELSPVNTGGVVTGNGQVIVSTFAGSGSQGSADGIGTAASFKNPGGISIDYLGNIYVADLSNNKIRKITSSGVVSSFAGSGVAGSTEGTKGSASFNFPTGVFVDVSGIVYVADYNNYKVRKISTAGIVSTLAGSGSLGNTDGLGSAASFNTTEGIVGDNYGNIYVADVSNNKIKKVTSTGNVTTLAGNGTQGASDGIGANASFYSPPGLVIDASGNIYVADKWNNKIRKISPAGNVTTFAGSSSQGSADGIGIAASFYKPNGVALDMVGNLYVADQYNHKIRKISPSGVVSTLAGNGVATFLDGAGNLASFNNPTGVAVDTFGNVYVADQSNQKIRKITPGFGYTISPALPSGLSFDGSTGNISGIATVATSATTYTITATNLAGSSSTTVSIATVPLPTITSFTPTSGCSGTVVTITGKDFTGTTAVSIGGVAVASFTVNSSTSISAVITNGNVGAVRVTTANGTGVGGGNFTLGNNAVPFAYVANQVSNSVSVINTFTNALSTTVSVGTQPVGVCVSPDGTKVYVANNISNSISVINTRNNTVTASVAVGTYPEGVCVSPDGTILYVANSKGNTVSVINTSNNTVSSTVPVGNSPFGISVSPDGTIVYVGNVTGNSVSVISTATNTVTTTIPVGTNPYGICFNSDGSKVYVTNEGGNSVSIIDTRSQSISATIAVGKTPHGVCVSPDGKKLYISNQDDNTVSVINTATNTVSATISVGVHPFGISVNPDGTMVYVVNVGGNVSVINTSTNLVVATLAVGSSPYSLGNFIANVTAICSPSITSFTPAAASTGATITIKGSNFTGTTSVSFGGTAATSFSVVNDTTITAVVGSGTSGNVSITNVSGTGSLAGFCYSIVPTVSISSSSINVCSGNSVTLTASIGNSGSSPSYQWQVNDNNVGSNSSTYTYTPSNGDVISCLFTSNSSCGTPLTIISNSITEIVNPIPVIAINTSGTCVGSLLTATGTNIASLKWYNSGTLSSTQLNTYTPITGGNYTAIATSIAGCNVTSNSIDINALVTPSISIISSPIGSVCNGSSVTYTASPSNGGSSPAYQWVNNGNLISGANTATYSYVPTNGDVIHCILTANNICQTTATATSSSITASVNTNLIPGVSIAITSGSQTICAGTSVSFTATPTNGGSTPTYQWKKNGSIVGTSSTTYTDGSLNNGDVITCVLTANNACQTTSTSTSNSITESVFSNVVPSVSIAATATTICMGTSVSFTATPTNGGFSPSYQWKKNGFNVGTNSTTYTDAGLSNNDLMTCVLTSNNTCQTTSSATSNSITETVTDIVVPSVSIVSTATTICNGNSVTFTATPTNGGGSPDYLWKKNGVNVGSNSATYTARGINNNDVISCVLTANNTCQTTATANSNNITETVNAYLTPTVTLAASATSICAGSSVTFTATPASGCSSPTYQWQKNGSIVGTSTITYTDGGLNNGDVISVTLVANNTCQTASTATSNVITETVTQNVTPSVIIASDVTSVCTGTTVNLTATPTNGGALPTYQWKKGGVNISGATSATYSYMPNNADAITCVLTSSIACVTTNTATSNSVIVTVTAPTTPSVSINTQQTTLCAGTPITITATPTNGGQSPTYQWKLNGANIAGATSTTYSYLPTNGDVMTCVLSVSASCATASSPTSNSITLTVNPSVTPTINIVAGSTTICAGTSVTFTATTTNGGSSPTYQWTKNGTFVGTSISTYTDATIQNGDLLNCALFSNATCATSPSGANNSVATSNYITETVINNVTPSVNIAITSGSQSICAGTSVTFTATPANGGGSPSYQWKKNGSNVGSNSTTYSTTSLSEGDIISCVLTANNTCQTIATATSNSITETVSANVTPSVSITGSANNICIGTSVTFTATPTNGGGSPAYQWKKNGSNVGANSTTYTDGALANGDVITCVLTANNTCQTSATATSNSITETVNSYLTPSVSIAITSGSQSICSGTSVTFTATPTSGGGSPSYQWKKNGNNVGSNSPTYTTTALSDGDIISCVLTSNNACQTTATATSNSITETVTTNVTPSVSIAITGGSQSICSGTSVTFTATPSNGGGSPSYQWKKNGSNVGTNSTSYTTTALTDGDIIICVLTGNNTCQTTSTATSNSITETVTSYVTPSVSIAITSGSQSICAGTSVTFTATPTNGGGSPSYQWKKNGSNVGTNSTSYTTTALTDGDIISCVLTANNTCQTTATATSNSITETVTSYVTPSVSIAITSGSQSICSGTSVTFTATPTNGGSSPAYQWKKNGSDVGTNSTSYTTTTLTDADIISCVLTANNTCQTSATSTSNSITETVTTNITPSVSIAITSGSQSICAGTNVTFTATPTNGGVSPIYQWKKNGSNVGSNSTSYTTTTLTDADIISCVLTANNTCQTSAIATSNIITETVTANVTPSVSIAITSGSQTICSGTSVTFTATPTNGGSIPSYQWQKNGNNIGRNSTTYTDTRLSNNDVITCVLTANNTCQTNATATSNLITESVTANVTPSITIATLFQTVTAGTSVTFTSTPIHGGNTPSYQWKKNGGNVGTNSATYTTSTLADGDIVTCVLTANNTCQTSTDASSNSITMNISTAITWTGSVSSDWNTAANWNVNAVPVMNSSVTIPSVLNKPSLSSDVIIENLNLVGTLSINGHILTINGAVTGSGTLKGSTTSSLVIEGTAGTLLFDVNSNSLANLTITNSGSATLGNALNVYGTFTPLSGTFNTGDNLTLKSTSIDNTAVVGLVGGSINGKVAVERFIPNGLRTYRDIGASGVANAGNIYNNWQESGVNNNGYGIYITGSKGLSLGTDTTTGLDYSFTGNHSLFTYINNKWDSVLTTKGTSLDPYQGFRVLVRGNRTGSIQTQMPMMWSNATLRTKGDIITGQVSFSTSGVAGNYPSSYGLTSGSGNCSFIANPYSSIVDWEAVAAGSQNINQSYWYCDPTNTTDGNSDGYTVFVGYNALSHTASNPLGTSKVNRYLQPGQAFFVENSSSGSPLVVFNESNKVPNATRLGIFGTTPVVNRIAVGISRAGKNVDGAVSVFGNSFSKSIGAEDAIKFSNVGENIAFTLGGKDLCINGFTLPTSKDELPLHIYNLNANTTYNLRLDVSQFLGNSVAVYLKDNLAGTQIQLAGDSTIVSFSTNATNAASFANRYVIVFGTTTLPVSNIAVVSSPLKGNQVEVKWSVDGVVNVASYTVEHSVDGVNFSDLITVGIATSNNYSFIDENAVTGTNYYRIKTINADGTNMYSNISKLTTNNSLRATIAVYPNPVVGNSFNLTFANVSSEKYKVSIFNKLGQKVFENVVNHAGTLNLEQVNLSKQLSAGSYTLQVVGKNGLSYKTEIEVK